MLHNNAIVHVILVCLPNLGEIFDRCIACDNDV